MALAAAAGETPPDGGVRARIDWQAHPSMHIPWPMYGRGLVDRPLRRRTWRHRFRQTMSVDRLGLAHPGLLPGWWQRVEEEGVDLAPMERSAERFLQLWAQARGEG